MIDKIRKEPESPLIHGANIGAIVEDGSHLDYHANLANRIRNLGRVVAATAVLALGAGMTHEARADAPTGPQTTVTTPENPAVVQPGAQPSAETLPGPEGQLRIKTELSSVSFSFETSKKSVAQVEIGTDTNYGLSVLDRRKTKHTIFIRGLRPATKYYYRLITDSAGSRPVVGSFETGPIQPATVSVKNGKLVLNGQPFFPIMADQEGIQDTTQKIVADNATLGVNVLSDVFLGELAGHEDGPQTFEDMHNNILLGRLWLGISNRNSRPGIPEFPEKLDMQQVRRQSHGLGGELMSRNDKSSASLYRGLRAAVRAATGTDRAVIYSAWIANPPVPGVTHFLDGPRFRNVFWTAVAAGAQGIELLTQMRADPAGNVIVKPDVQAAAKQAADQMAVLGPAVLTGARVEAILAPGSPPVVLGVWRHSGAVYIVAANTENVAASSVFTVPGLKGTTAEALWERQRTVPIEPTDRGGKISDAFEPFGIHLYKILPKVKVVAKK